MGRTMDRRRFLGGAAAGGLAFGAGLRPVGAGSRAQNRVTVVVMGTGGRGTSLATTFAQQPGVEVLYACDADRGRAEKAASAVAKVAAGKAPQAVTDFRRVLFTGPNMQLVTMSLHAAEDIGEETHAADQCFFFVEGKGESVIAGKVTPITGRDVVCVPAGTRHNIRNTGDKPLKLYTLYAPPQHPAGTVHPTKADAERAETKH